ncbi:alkaline phosphatase family protein [Ferrimonas marina]|uniref:Type I phosphodiesterase / nucleotide pyrophosphatase n=1 Tax=Ferrimonas marina TaxID=299255 RepID=A0A1M5YRN0_9GAMM|nr:ectonucleotide pyrophosphatase/phosphodiesterase [Ferrimonas marina]SHI14736.1 Type I phosphodiesterase / nucleotide pyrophosphatase [Ferrimonas marina]
MRLGALLISLLSSLLLLAGCATNSEDSKQPHLLLISIDGYRYDYTELHQPPMLSEFAKDSAMVERFTPAYPTLTFPNHVTLVTGLLPEHHGIVANGFYSPELQEYYSPGKTDNDGRFYGGVPLWSLAESQDMKAATYFWVGSEAEIAGYRPSYWKPFVYIEDFQIRVDQVVDWFALPQDERPQLVTLYFSEVDSAGHRFGPDAPQTRDALHKVDAALAQLFARLDELSEQEGLDINIIITSDHGMANVEDDPRYNVDDVLRDHPELKEKFLIRGTAAVYNIHKQDGATDADLEQIVALFNATDGVEAFQRNDVPLRLRFKGHSAVGDAIIVTNDHYLTYDGARPGPIGMHGYETAAVPQMNTLMMARGPAFEPHARIEQADNIHLYPLMAEILGLTIEQPIDGELAPLAPLLAR